MEHSRAVRRPRRGHVRVLRGAVCLGLLTWAELAVDPATASAGTIQVTVNGEAPVTVDSGSAPAADVIGRNYTVLGAVGSPHVYGETGFSPAALLNSLSVSPSAVTSFRVQRGDGSWIVLSGAETQCVVASVVNCPFPDGPAVFNFDGVGASASARFLR